MNDREKCMAALRAFKEVGDLEKSITRDYCDGSRSIGGQVVMKGSGHCDRAIMVRKYNPETGQIDFVTGKAYYEDDRDETYIEFLNRVGDDFVIACSCCGRTSISKVSLEDAVRMWNEGEIEQ